MRVRGPIVTLIVGVVIAAVLLIVSAHAKASPAYGQSDAPRQASAVGRP